VTDPDRPVHLRRRAFVAALPALAIPHSRLLTGHAVQVTTIGVGAGMAAAVTDAAAGPGEHSRAGPVTPPAKPPPVRLTTHDGRAGDLRRLLEGRVSAVQLMFTGCSALCPIQGAVFADALGRLGSASPRVRLLSISIDPLGDDANALHAWLRRFGDPTPRWLAAVPHVADLGALQRFLRGNSPAGSGDSHTTQVFLFDTRADLVMVSTDLPSGAQVASLLKSLDDR
jgi:protein SCO1/2